MMGMDSLSFLCNRMFNVMDRHSNGHIYLRDYLDYFDVMLHGSEQEKMQQTFDLLDIKGKGKIFLPDFKDIVISFAQMWSNAMGGQPVTLTSSYIKNTFQLIAEGKDYFDSKDYSKQMEVNPNLLSWFNKPEQAMNDRLNKKIDD